MYKSSFCTLSCLKGKYITVQFSILMCIGGLGSLFLCLTIQKKQNDMTFYYTLTVSTFSYHQQTSFTARSNPVCMGELRGNLMYCICSSLCETLSSFTLSSAIIV